MRLPYEDRTQAGRMLADALQHYAGRSDLLILALPRGGVPVAFEVAKALDAPLDLLLVRKLGLPRHKELAMGAIASGGVRVLNEHLVERMGISEETIEKVAEEEGRELRRREQAYRGDWPAPEIRGRCVIVIDDGLATGSTMRAAVSALRTQQPSQIVVAVPVAPAETVTEFQREVDEIVCPATPEGFMSIGQWYEDFPQTSDQEVRGLLNRAWKA